MYRSPFKAKARMTTPFKKKGNWSAGYHTGEDWVCDSNYTLVSPADGTIIRNAYDKSYGNFVVIRTKDNKVILMAHMKKRSSVAVNSAVKAGDTIGTMGNTGNSYGAHLHIEVQNSKTWAYNKNLLKPSAYIDFKNYSGKSELSEDVIDMTKEEVVALIEETVTRILKGENTVVSEWAKDDFARAIEAGITDGSCPQGYATRQEVALMNLRSSEK